MSGLQQPADDVVGQGSRQELVAHVTPRFDGAIDCRAFRIVKGSGRSRAWLFRHHCSFGFGSRRSYALDSCHMAIAATEIERDSL